MLTKIDYFRHHVNCMLELQGLKLRMQHFHCFSDHGEGGHFHFDTTPEEAEYVGYFNVPEYMYRVDMFQIEKSDALGM